MSSARSTLFGPSGRYRSATSYGWRAWSGRASKTNVAVQKEASFRRLHVALKCEKCPSYAGFLHFRWPATSASPLVNLRAISCALSTVRVDWESLDATRTRHGRNMALAGHPLPPARLVAAAPDLRASERVAVPHHPAPSTSTRLTARLQSVEPLRSERRHDENLARRGRECGGTLLSHCRHRSAAANRCITSTRQVAATEGNRGCCARRRQDLSSARRPADRRRLEGRARSTAWQIADPRRRARCHAAMGTAITASARAKTKSPKLKSPRFLRGDLGISAIPSETLEHRENGVFRDGQHHPPRR